MKFEELYNNTMTAIGIAVAVHECYKTYLKVQDMNARHAADVWEMEASARFYGMVAHAYRNNISKEGLLEAIEAAKNVISFEADELLPNNVYAGSAVRNLHAKLDAYAAER